MFKVQTEIDKTHTCALQLVGLILFFEKSFETQQKCGGSFKLCSVRQQKIILVPNCTFSPLLQASPILWR